jgi:hypothetical protein
MGIRRPRRTPVLHLCSERLSNDPDRTCVPFFVGESPLSSESRVLSPFWESTPLVSALARAGSPVVLMIRQKVQCPVLRLNTSVEPT